MSKIAVGSTDIEWVPKRPPSLVEDVAKMQKRAVAMMKYATWLDDLVHDMVRSGLWSNHEATAEIHRRTSPVNIAWGFWGGGK